MSNKDATSMDFRIGQRIRRARIDASITQQELGKHLGRSSQQVHKYERGTNRVSAGTLYAISELVGRSMDWFFLDEADALSGPGSSWVH